MKRLSASVLTFLVLGGLICLGQEYTCKKEEKSCTPPHSVTLKWNASPSKVEGYNVYRKKISDANPYLRINRSLVRSTTYEDKEVEAGASYYYVVSAVDACGTESSFSNKSYAKIPSP